jgi:hypothetical protein
MEHRLIEEYLTHYQPEQKAELIRQGRLQAYLASQAEAMAAATQQIIAQLQASQPQMSPYQREIEAAQTVRELFLPLA